LIKEPGDTKSAKINYDLIYEKPRIFKFKYNKKVIPRKAFKVQSECIKQNIPCSFELRKFLKERQEDEPLTTHKIRETFVS
jgi:hypothetical protein